MFRSYFLMALKTIIFSTVLSFKNKCYVMRAPFFQHNIENNSILQRISLIVPIQHTTKNAIILDSRLEETGDYMKCLLTNYIEPWDHLQSKNILNKKKKVMGIRMDNELLVSTATHFEIGILLTPLLRTVY